MQKLRQENNLNETASMEMINRRKSTEEQTLLELSRMRMPFGKYSGRLLIDLPEPYVIWFSQKGFPGGKLGEMLKIVYEIKVNGLEYLFDPFRENLPGNKT